MTRDEAIKLFRRDIECLSHDKCSDCILEKVCDPMKTPFDSEYIEAYGMAIEALSAEPCEDCISRQAAIDAIEEDKRNGNDSCFASNYDAQCFKQIIKELPPVKPEQKMGHWIMSEDGLYRPICDKCSAHPWKGYIPTTKEATEVFKYCPNCGAKMEGEDADSN